MSDSDHLPPKPEVALALLQTSPSVYVHLDPRHEDALVPQSFKKQPQLVLQIGMNMAVAIPDLDVGDDELSCTLSFNRRPHFCRLPWEAIYGLIGEDGRGMIWPDSVPPEVTAAAEGRAQGPKSKRPKLRLASSRAEDEVADSEERSPAERGLQETESAHAPEALADPSAEKEAPSVPAEEETEPEEKPDEQGDSEDGGAKGRRLPPYLRVVK